MLEEFHLASLKVPSIACRSQVRLFMSTMAAKTTVWTWWVHSLINSSISVIGLSRNFGKESAMSAGLEYCRGQAVILLGCWFTKILRSDSANDRAKWREGYDVSICSAASVMVKRGLAKLSVWAASKVMNVAAKIDVLENVGDFRLLSRGRRSYQSTSRNVTATWKAGRHGRVQTRHHPI